MKTIKITCETGKTLPLGELTEFQGDLKYRKKQDIEKVQKSILKYGFSFPFFVWQNGKHNFILDGHGRKLALKKMWVDGYEIPELPVIYIECKNINEAKQKLLRLNSQYGKMTKDTVLEFSKGLDVNFEEISLPEGVISFDNDEQADSEQTEGDDETPEVDEKSEPVSKRGEMYELGNSILMCGDSTNAEDVARLMGGGEG